MWIPTVKALKIKFEAFKNAKSEAEKRNVPMGEGISLVRDMFVADTMEEAKEKAGQHMVDYMKWVCHWRGLGNHMDPGEELPETKGKLDLLNYEFLHKRNMLFGTPEYVIDKIHELKSELNLQNLHVWSNFPGIKHQDCMKSIKLFTEKVMPHFKDDIDTEVKKSFVIKPHRKLTGGEAAVKSLKKENVKHVFGLIGSATMEMFDALYHEKNIKFIGVRDERTGTHMADGYARASNQPGVILAGQNGPGATNLVTGIAQAKAAFSPVVAIAGSYSTKDKMEDAFQGLDQQSLFTPITKKTWTVKSSKIIPNIMSDAFNLAMKPRRGPVCVNLPRNILAATNNYNININKPSFSDESSLRGKDENIKKISKNYQSS